MIPGQVEVVGSRVAGHARVAFEAEEPTGHQARNSRHVRMLSLIG
jgi:hypothetical protein